MRRPSILLGTLFLAACGGEPADQGNPDVNAIVLGPADTSLYVGGSFGTRATMTTPSGDVLPADHVEYVALDDAVSVSSTGVVTGGAIGRTRVVAIRGELRDTGWVSVVPEGTIAFNWYTDAARLAVSTISLDGSSVSLLTPTEPSPFISGATTWLPDGRIVVERQDPQLPPLLYLATPDGTVSTLFTPAPEDAAKAQRWPRASRDGQWVYFAWDEDLWRLHPDGTGFERITDTESLFPDQYPDPSPDGNRLVFLHNRIDGNGSGEMIVRDLATGVEQSLGVLGFVPRWSPDGQWIAFWKDGEDFPGYPKPAIWLIRPDGTDERRLTSEPYLPSGKGLDWSPDGAWLVTTSLSTIDLLEVATGNVLPLAWANQGSDWPSWKP